MVRLWWNFDWDCNRVSGLPSYADDTYISYVQVRGRGGFWHGSRRSECSFFCLFAIAYLSLQLKNAYKSYQNPIGAYEDPIHSL